MSDRCPYGDEECPYAECEERDHTCGCGDCCDACWFDCCASAEGILVACDMAVDFDDPITNCGFVPLAQLDFLINEWTKRKDNPA